MTDQTRAPKGGTVGTNGEFYEGGKFLSTTRHPKSNGSKRTATRKQNVGPYQWAVAPVEGAHAIFAKYQEFITFDGDNATPTASEQTMAYYGVTADSLQKIVDAWELGMRWVSADGTAFYGVE